MARENFLIMVAPVVGIVILLICASVTVRRSYNNNNSAKTSMEMYSSNDDSCSCPSFVTEASCADSSEPVLGGVDVVQYFTDFKLADGTFNETEVGVAGSSAYASVYNDFTFYFKSAANQALFEASPSSYVPQYGGFCTWGMTAETCPTYPWAADCLGPGGNWAHWTIQDDKLYFFLFDNAKAKFMADPSTYIAQGDTRWATWFPTTNSYFSTKCFVSSGTSGQPAHTGSSFKTPKGKPLAS